MLWTAPPSLRKCRGPPLGGKGRDVGDWPFSDMPVSGSDVRFLGDERTSSKIRIDLGEACRFAHASLGIFK